MTTNEMIVKISNDWAMCVFYVGFAWAAAYAFSSFYKGDDK